LVIAAATETPRGQRSHAVGARLPSSDGNLEPHLLHYEKDNDDSDGANGNDVRGGAQERHARASLICPSISVILVCRGGVKPPGSREHKEHDKQHAFTSRMADSADSRIGQGKCT
jgi:hypothetical protein